MKKEETLKILTEDHKKMEKIIELLTKEEMLKIRVLGVWSVKDVIAHLSAWNLELTKSIDIILRNEELWFLNTSDVEFNKIQITKRKSYSLEEVIEEWKNSFIKLIERIKNLSEKEWDFQSEFFWGGKAVHGKYPVTVKSLFEYKYKGESHEGGHAKQIEEYFDRDDCSCQIY
jgi:hypothetical protein